MKRALIVLTVVLIAAAYLGGFLPEHQRLADATARADMLQQRLTAAEADVRLGVLLGQLLRLSDAVAARNYGEAAMLSSGYFDQAQQELSRATGDPVKQALQRILQTRDDVTAALARSDPSVASTLNDQETLLRRALGYPVDTQAGPPRQ